MQNHQNFSALMILDMQNGVVANAYQRDVVVANLQILIQKARDKRTPIIWIQHSDENIVENSNGWRLLSDLNKKESELLVAKKYGDAFEATNLSSELNRLNIKNIFVTGAQTDACVRATLHGSFVRGYNTILVSDAHTTEDLTMYGLPAPEQIIAFTNIYWTWQTGPGRKALVMKTSEVEF